VAVIGCRVANEWRLANQGPYSTPSVWSSRMLDLDKVMYRQRTKGFIAFYNREDRYVAASEAKALMPSERYIPDRTVRPEVRRQNHPNNEPITRMNPRCRSFSFPLHTSGLPL
jgi:hypothetical protein